MISPAVLLLSDCASTVSDQPQASGSRASPALDRVQVSSRSAMNDPFETLFHWEQFEISENEPAWFAPEELTFKETEETNTVQIAPLVVTETTLPDVAPEAWPCDVVDAELKAAWISPRESGSSRRHMTEDSVSEWMRSLR